MEVTAVTLSEASVESLAKELRQLVYEEIGHWWPRSLCRQLVQRYARHRAGRGAQEFCALVFALEVPE